MKFLITGGAGFLGLHLTHKIINEGHKAVLLDIQDYEKAEYPDKNVEYIIGDVRDKKKVTEALKGVDVCLHCAAALPLEKKKEIFSTNVDGTNNTLKLCLENKIKRVVFISSTAVYGVPKVHPLYEHHPMIGVGKYGKSKIMGEQVVEKYRKKGLIVSVIRPKTFIGTYRLGVFQILYDWVLNGAKIPFIGNGKNQYQLLEVDDLCDAIYLAATVKDDKLANDTYNVGAKDYTTVREDMNALCNHAAEGSRSIGFPAWLCIPSLRFLELLRLSPLYKWVYGTAHRDSFVSVEKIQKNLGWEPKYSNKDALIRSYDWYIKNHIEVEKEKAGVSHRVPWSQGALRLVRWFMKIGHKKRKVLQQKQKKKEQAKK